MEPMMIIKVKSEGAGSPVNDGDSKYKMEIAEKIKEIIDMCQEKGSETKMVIEHLQMALKELEDGGMEEEDDDIGMMMKDKKMSFGESLMKKSEEEGYSKSSE